MQDYSQITNRTTPHGIMFHHFHKDGGAKTQGSVEENRLLDIIEFLGRGKILDARVWAEKAVRGRLEPGDLCLTFDDSLLCQKEIAWPVLKNLGLTAFFFVYSAVFEGQLVRLEIYKAFRTRCFEDVESFYEAFFRLVERSRFGRRYRRLIEGWSPESYLEDYPFYTVDDRKFRYVRDRILGPKAYTELMDRMVANYTSIAALSESLWMTDDDLAELASAGNVVGLHSYTHPTVFGELPLHDQREEFRKNSDHITRVVGERPWAMSHPSNSYNGETLEILTDLGVKLGFRSNMTLVDRTGLEYPREDHANIVRMMASSTHQGPVRREGPRVTPEVHRMGGL